jgi:hypothetical protein
MTEPQLAENVLNQERRKTRFLQGCLDCLRRPKGHQLRYLVHSVDRILSSFAWKSLIVVFTIVLLFGSPIQFLFTPKEADTVFDVLYTLALIVFVIDMMLNMAVDPDYFGCDPFRRNRVQPFDQAKFCTYGIGSFRMWCDVVSTAALLFDISYINPLYYQEETLELTLDEFGLLVGSLCLKWIHLVLSPYPTSI